MLFGYSKRQTDRGRKRCPFEPRIRIRSTGTSAGIFVDRAPGGERLSLLSNGKETEHETGFFAHAYSVIVFDGLSAQGYTEFSTYYGAHKTARTPNTVTDIVFRIFVDNEEKFTSDTMTA